MLCTIGDLVEDVVVWLHEPVRLGTDAGARVERSLGGSAANVARFAANLGLSARFVGHVGDDPLGANLINQMSAAGVEVVAERGGRSGSIVVIVGPDGERSFLSDRGSSADLDGPDLAWLDGVDWLHVPAYSLFGGSLAVTARALLRLAVVTGLAVSVDASSAGLVDDVGPAAFIGVVDDAFAGTRDGQAVVFANADEYRRLGPLRWTTVVKRGPLPAFIREMGSVVAEIPAMPVDKTNVRDTTGAGDAFAAGFIASRVNGSSFVRAVESGHAAAARVLGEAGANLAS